MQLVESSHAQITQAAAESHDTASKAARIVTTEGAAWKLWAVLCERCSRSVNI